MTTIEDQIIKVETKIEEVEQQIAAVERKLEGELSQDDKAYFREEKKQLREKKKQLREEKNLLLARQQSQQDGELRCCSRIIVFKWKVWLQLAAVLWQFIVTLTQSLTQSPSKFHYRRQEARS
jgi:hypothetical protein